VVSSVKFQPNPNIYLKVPTKIFSEDDFDKKILIWWWLYVNENRNNDIRFVFSEMIEDCGYCANVKNRNINYTFKNILKEMFENKQIVIQSEEDTDNFLFKDSERIFNKKYIFRFVKNKNNKNFFQNIESDFVICYNTEIRTIINAYKDKKVNCSLEKIIKVYFCMKSYINMNKDSIQVFFPSITTIQNKLGISRSTVIATINDLKNMDMIYNYNLPTYVNSKSVKKRLKSVYSTKPYTCDIVKMEMSKKITGFKRWVTEYKEELNNEVNNEL